VKYVVTADDKLIDGQVERIQNNWYCNSSRSGCSRFRFTGTFKTKKKGINNTTISLDAFQDKATADKFIGKVGDVVTVNTKVYLKMHIN
jgi:trigger factor